MVFLRSACRDDRTSHTQSNYFRLYFYARFYYYRLADQSNSVYDFEKILLSKCLQKLLITIAPALRANIIPTNITLDAGSNNLTTATNTEIAVVTAITIAGAIINGISSTSVNSCCIFNPS